MKSSWKIFNLIFSLVILLIIGAGLYLVNSYNNTSWKNQEKAAIKSGEYAYESAYSYMELYSEKLTSGNLIALQTQIKNILGDTVTSVSLTDSPNNTISQYAQYNSDLQKIYINKGDRINLAIFVCINNFNDFYYLTVEKDFTPLSEIQLRNWRLFAYGAAGLIILGGALLIMVNLLKKESEKNKKFMENFAHELKTPMTSILGYSSMMSTYDLDEEEKNKALGALTFEAKRLDSLSKQMLELFVIQKERPEMLPVEARKIEEALSISLKELSEKYGIPHTLDFAPGVFECNEILLLSLITNLCDNAFKATINGEPVEISGRAVGDKYRIRVADHGVGIAKKNIAKIMEPFFREDKARARSMGGAGLGLSLCSEIAKIHGTKLTYKSVKNKGTKVTFDLRLIQNMQESKRRNKEGGNREK